MREQRSARGAWQRSARVPRAALCCPARRGTAQRGNVQGSTGNALERLRAFLHPYDAARQRFLPTTCTAPARHAALLLLCCHQRLPNAHHSPRAGLNRLVMPRPGARSAAPRREGVWRRAKRNYRGRNDRRRKEIVAKTRDELMLLASWCEQLQQLHAMDAAVGCYSPIICGRISRKC